MGIIVKLVYGEIFKQWDKSFWGLILYLQWVRNIIQSLPFLFLVYAALLHSRMELVCKEPHGLKVM